jgi:hypothetical protein
VIDGLLRQIASGGLRFSKVNNGTVYHLSDGDWIEVHGEDAIASVSDNQALMYLINENTLYLFSIHATNLLTLMGMYTLMPQEMT